MNARITQVRVLTVRFVRERRVLIAGVTLGAMTVFGMQLAMYRSIRPSLVAMSEGLPSFLEELVGSAEFATPEGFLQAEAFGSMGPILVTIVAVSVAASALAGEERSGRMDLLATTGVQRETIAASAVVAMVAAVSIMITGYWLTAVSGAWLVGLGIGFVDLTAACVSLWALGLALGASSFAVGAVTGSRGAAVGAGSALAVWSYVAYGLLPLASSLRFTRRLSLWYPYADPQPLWNGPAVGATVSLLAVAVGLVSIGIAVFRRRDIG